MLVGLRDPVQGVYVTGLVEAAGDTAAESAQPGAVVALLSGVTRQSRHVPSRNWTSAWRAASSHMGAGCGRRAGEDEGGLVQVRTLSPRAIWGAPAGSREVQLRIGHGLDLTGLTADAT